MNTLITYDVSRRHPEVKKTLKELKYLDYWTKDGIPYYLPNTTMWKREITPDDTLKEMKAIIAKLNHGQPLTDHIELERCACVPVNPWAAIPGKLHKE